MISPHAAKVPREPAPVPAVLRASAVLTVLNIAAGMLGYAFQVGMGRVLRPGDFSNFNAILASVSLCSAPLNAVGMVLVRQVAILRSSGSLAQIRVLYRRVNLWLGTAACALIAAMRFVEPILDFQDHVTKLEDMAIFVAIAALSSLTLLNNAFLQGLRQFWTLGGLGVLIVVVKIAMCYALVVALDWGLRGALGGVLSATCAVAVIGTVVVVGSSGQPGASHAPHLSFPTASVLPVAAATIGLASLSQADLIVVNKFFDPAVAGDYSIAAILGRSVLYLPAGIALTLLPMVAEDHAADRCSSSLARQSLLAVFGLCAAVAVAPWLVSTLYGDRYPAAAGLLAAYGFAAMPLGLALVAEHFLIAKGRMTVAWVLLAAALAEIATLMAWHPSPWAVITVMAAFNGATALICCLMMLPDLGTSRPGADDVSRRSGGDLAGPDTASQAY